MTMTDKEVFELRRNRLIDHSLNSVNPIAGAVEDLFNDNSLPIVTPELDFALSGELFGPVVTPAEFIPGLLMKIDEQPKRRSSKLYRIKRSLGITTIKSFRK